jgi:hypothetical protein
LSIYSNSDIFIRKIIVRSLVLILKRIVLLATALAFIDYHERVELAILSIVLEIRSGFTGPLIYSLETIWSKLFTHISKRITIKDRPISLLCVL